MMKVLISGASGLIGSALIPLLQTGHHQIYKLVRAKSNLSPDEIVWDPEKGIINKESLENFDAVVHLAGENIAGRWTTQKKMKILDSRVNGTKLLCKTLGELKHPPEVLISGSAIGIYGDRGDQILNESSSSGQGFLAEVCLQWEAATASAKQRGIRTVNLRTGTVLSQHGGALKKMLIPFKLCLGGAIGSGDQYMSWIGIKDLIGIIFYTIQQRSIEGPINAVSPNPVTNKEFAHTLGKVLGRPTFLNVPEFMIKLVFGEMGEEVLLASERVNPEVLIETGYLYHSLHLEDTLREELGADATF